VSLDKKFIFLASGRVFDRTNGVVGWDAIREAKAAFARVPKQSVSIDFVPTIAEQWGYSINGNIARYISPQELNALKDKQTYVDGTFIHSDVAGEIQGAYERLRYRAAMKSIVSEEVFVITPPEEMFYTAVGGERAVFTEFLEGKTKRAQLEVIQTKRQAKMWNPADADALMAIRLAQLTIKYASDGNHAGGDIDAVELKRGGSIRWVRRKQLCKKEQSGAQRAALLVCLHHSTNHRIRHSCAF
jgi:hypothetical protein